MEAITGARPGRIRYRAEHVLFVEGAATSRDQPVLETLLRSQIRVEPLGGSFSVRNVAEALVPVHPTYYFLIDRDHHDDDFVDFSWSNFPDPDTRNLLVWRQRELENYFLDATYLATSEYCTCDTDGLRGTILRRCNSRLYLDAANRVITSLREDFKRTWIQHFRNPEEFLDRADTLARLVSREEFSQYGQRVARGISNHEIEQRLDERLAHMTGGTYPLQFGRGAWLATIRGKKVLSQVVNACFNVTDRSGAHLDGAASVVEVMRELVAKDLEDQPADFRALKQLIDARVQSDSEPANDG